MKKPRFSIAGLLMGIPVVAIGLAALSRPSCLWASATFSLLLLALTVALIGVLYRRGHKQAFWSGCLICGSLYTVLSLAPWFDSHIGPRLITTALLDLLYPKTPLLLYSPNTSIDPWMQWTGAPPDYPLTHPRFGFTMGSTDEFHGKRASMLMSTTDEFLLIGHSLFGMLAAIGGGFLAVHFYEPSCRSGP
jgi:hypothetical protein